MGVTPFIFDRIGEFLSRTGSPKKRTVASQGRKAQDTRKGMAVFFHPITGRIGCIRGVTIIGTKTYAKA